jgi:hypothetical protein
MSKLRCLATACLAFAGLALPAVAEALICETLGAAASRFDVVVADKVDARPRRPYAGYYGAYCATWGLAAEGMATCSSSARFFGASLDSCTATRSTGTAVRFKDGGEECGQSTFLWEIYTGGGTVQFSGPINFTPDLVDTTGTHPGVDACSGAIDQMKTASQAFAAMTPVKTIDKIRVNRGEHYVLDATGGGVINIGKLTMEGVPVGPYNGYRVGTCVYNIDTLGKAELTINSNPSDEVVLNIGYLELGPCADIYTDSPVLVNLPGPGRKIRIGLAAFNAGNFPPDILAPERTVAVTGGRTEEITPVSGVYARKLVTLGYVYNVPPLCKTCGNGVVDTNEECDATGCAEGFVCDDTCSCSTRCGDGIVAGAEVCDGTSGCTGGEYCNRACSACEPCPSTVIPTEGGTFRGRTDDQSPERTFGFTPAVSGPVTIDLCGSSYDTTVEVLGGACTGSSLAYNDDYCGPESLQSYLSPVLTAGQTYTIVVGGYEGKTGSFVLRVTPPSP